MGTKKPVWIHQKIDPKKKKKKRKELCHLVTTFLPGKIRRPFACSLTLKAT